MFLVEERDDGVLLRLSTAIPVRDIAKETIEGWISEDEAAMAALREDTGEGSSNESS